MPLSRLSRAGENTHVTVTASLQTVRRCECGVCDGSNGTDGEEEGEGGNTCFQDGNERHAGSTHQTVPFKAQDGWPFP